jgi:hypothetical protein
MKVYVRIEGPTAGNVAVARTEGVVYREWRAAEAATSTQNE